MVMDPCLREATKQNQEQNKKKQEQNKQKQKQEKNIIFFINTKILARYTLHSSSCGGLLVRAFCTHSIIWWCLRHHILAHNHLYSPYIPHIQLHIDPYTHCTAAHTSYITLHTPLIAIHTHHIAIHTPYIAKLPTYTLYVLPRTPIWVPICTHMYSHVPICTHMYLYVPLCTHMHPYAPICTPMYPYVTLCTPTYPYVPLCTPNTFDHPSPYHFR